MGPGQENITFSIITPAHNNPDEVSKLLDSLKDEVGKDPSLEVIVVDDCSDDSSLRDITKRSGFAKYIRLDNNSGPAAARNIGARNAGNDVLLFIDSDVIFNHDTLVRIRDKFKTDPSCKIFGGEYDIYPANPSLAARFKAIMVRSWSPKENSVSVFLTRLGAIRRDIFEKIGGFDVGLKTASVEDYELARRLIAKGYNIHYDPAITVKHHFPSFKSQLKLFFHRSFMWIYVFRKHGKFDNTCTTPMQGVAQAAGFLSVLFLLSVFLHARNLFISLFLFAVFAAGNMKFFLLALKHGGTIFMLQSIAMALVLSVPITLGAMCGMFYYYIYRPLTEILVSIRRPR